MFLSSKHKSTLNAKPQKTAFNASTLLTGHQEVYLACKSTFLLLSLEAIGKDSRKSGHKMVKKTQHTFVKIAKITAKSRQQKFSLYIC